MDRHKRSARQPKYPIGTKGAAEYSFGNGVTVILLLVRLKCLSNKSTFAFKNCKSFDVALNALHSSLL